MSNNNPFEHNYFIGYVNHVSPQYIKVHFPSSTLLNRTIFSGEEFYGGLIGTYVTVEGEQFGFIGKITEIDLPEKERLSLSEKAFQSSDFHPTAKVQILLSFDYFNSEVALRTLNSFPNIGAKVYICPSKFIQKYVMEFGKKIDDNELLISIGQLTSNRNNCVKLSQQSLFGRHCAIIGTTGGGKSWTLSKLLEGIVKNNTKAILIDPTGEYKCCCDNGKFISLSLGKEAYFPYQDLTIEDLFYLVKPAERVQAPKLLEAIRSLKCVKNGIGDEKLAQQSINLSSGTPQIIEGEYFKEFIKDGCLKKSKMFKILFERYYYKNSKDLDSDNLDFELKDLPKQLVFECIYDSDKIESSKFGSNNDNDVSMCVSLITRINNILKSENLQKIFGYGIDISQMSNLKDQIDKFFSDNLREKFLLRIGFEDIGYEARTREIAANAIGKYLLKKAREGDFLENPVVFFVDEAHQFLNKNIVDEYFSSLQLSSFDQIAKECRKYGLFLCLATQMPRDIPLGTLSQMGTFLVHRLINYNDKEAIKQACSSADSDMLAFLPVLGAGEMVLSGVDFPMPISIRVEPPDHPPNSHTPKFKKISENNNSV